MEKSDAQIWLQDRIKLTIEAKMCTLLLENTKSYKSEFISKFVSGYVQEIYTISCYLQHQRTEMILLVIISKIEQKSIMQTIIYTNCKREAANYEVDKICFTDRVDMNQLIQQEMNKYNIRNIHFWIITDNICNIQNVDQEKLLIGVVKYLTEKKFLSFHVQYIVQKYVSYFQSRFTKKQQGHITQYEEIKRHKTAMNLTSGKLSQTCPISNELNRKSQENEFQLSKSRLIQQQIIKESLQSPTLDQFEDFVKKQAKLNVDSESIKKYIFATSDQSITLSFIQSNKKNLIKRIIEQDCDRFYDAKLGIKKKSTFQSIQNYEVLCKKYNHSSGNTQTLYNKVLLFLFSADKNQQLTLTRKRTKLFQNKLNLSIQALNQWKIKEENVDMICKLEKECDLIKQQIQNQKIIFKNKIKMIQNFIGESINIQKLMQEEDIQSSNQLMPPTTQKKPILGKRNSILSPQVQQQGSPSRFSINTPYFTSQFKRLKDISDAIRNIDNTLFQQNKKIQSAHKRFKELIKNKQSIIFTNACELNKLRKTIIEAKSEIARKQIQIAQKQKNGDISQVLHNKSKEPSKNVKKTLQKYQQFYNNIKISQNLNPLEDLLSIQNRKAGLKINTNSEKRIIHKSLYCNSLNKFTINQQSMNAKLRQKRIQETEKFLSKLNQQKQQNFLKMEKVINKKIMIAHQRLNQKIEYTKSNNQNTGIIKQEIKIQQLYCQLVALFEFYKKNNQIGKEMKTQLQNYKIIKKQPLNSFIKQVTNNDKNLSHFIKSNLHCSQNQISVPESLQLEDFPILKQYILKEIQTENNSKKQNNTLNFHQNTNIFKQQFIYPRDYFQLMLYANRKQKKIESLMKTTTSINSQLYDRIIQGPSQTLTAIEKNQPPQKQPIKQKRITIEQAIKLSSHFNHNKNK